MRKETKEMVKGLIERLAPVSLIGYLFCIGSTWETKVTFAVVLHVVLAVFCLYHDHVEEVREMKNSLWRKDEKCRKNLA